MKRNGFLVGLLLLFAALSFEGCKDMFGPADPNELIKIEVDVRYDRKDDASGCPRTYFGDNPFILDHASLNGFPHLSKNLMDKVADDVFSKKVPNVLVDYLYTLFVADPVFATVGNPEADTDIRAHDIWLNGYLITKVHKSGCREEIRVKFDKNGVPYAY